MKEGVTIAFNSLNSRHIPPPRIYYKHIVIHCLRCRDALPCVSTVVFILFILFSPVLAVSDYELKPFKLKELPPQKERKDPLETMRVVSTLKDPPKEQIKPHIGIRVGFPFIFGHNQGIIERKLLYFSLFWRDRFLGDDLFYEIDLSYFAYKNKVTVTAGMSETHNFPITFSVLYSLKLSRSLRVNPKAGVGYMLAYGTSTLLGDRFSSFLVAKPGLEMEWTLSRRFSIHLGGDMLMTLPLKGSGITFFVIPNVGLSYGF
ncbi:MAG: hypothetical protein IEMM0008_1661 [bacterium]|nr:MAG: hypothetical protein IEMM0008_1661 [bacterium]